MSHSILLLLECVRHFEAMADCDRKSGKQRVNLGRAVCTAYLEGLLRRGSTPSPITFAMPLAVAHMSRPEVQPSGTRTSTGAVAVAQHMLVGAS